MKIMNVNRIFDDVIAKIGKIIEKARSSSRRFIADQRYDATNNKFITTNIGDGNIDNTSQRANPTQIQQEQHKQSSPTVTNHLKNTSSTHDKTKSHNNNFSVLTPKWINVEMMI